MASVMCGRSRVTLAEWRRVAVKAVMAGVRMVAGRMRMSKSRLDANERVSISQAAYRTGEPHCVLVISHSSFASFWAD